MTKTAPNCVKESALPLPHKFAAQRSWEAETVLNLSEHPTLDAAWKNSQQLLQQISDRLLAAPLGSRILAVVASGSLGRMEAVAGSDADLIVVLDNGIVLIRRWPNGPGIRSGRHWKHCSSPTRGAAEFLPSPPRPPPSATSTPAEKSTRTFPRLENGFNCSVTHNQFTAQLPMSNCCLM